MFLTIASVMWKEKKNPLKITKIDALREKKKVLITALFLLK